ncbi:MAG: diguanylate cyclase [Alphaproteobacteria bacterium]|nr:diguanylate cyclase [Alphaproteobacteria bacterium]
MSSLASALLAQTIDDHIGWMAAWSRTAFYEIENHTAQAENMPAPESFAVWRREAAKNLQDQPMLDRLVSQYDQLHRLARLVMMKAPEGQPVARADYDSVAAKYQEFIVGLRRLERALATAASGLDVLTGLRSRAGMQDDLQRELSRFQRSGKPFCLALMDIDFFKKINDTYGHDGGDKILSSVANHISRSLRPFDDAWRWGGEEFLLCLKEADLSAGAMALERVRAGLEKTTITLADGRAVNVTASFGVAVTVKDSTIDTLLAEADQALYRAKNEGRNRVEMASATKS